MFYSVEPTLTFWVPQTISKQARKSSEDTQVAGYAQFEKVRVSFGSKSLGPIFFIDFLAELDNSKTFFCFLLGTFIEL